MKIFQWKSRAHIRSTRDAKNSQSTGSSVYVHILSFSLFLFEFMCGYLFLNFISMSKNRE